MTYLIISDTHGDRRAVERMLHQIDFRPAGIFFLGDGWRDLAVIEQDPVCGDVPLYAVMGNCDAYSFLSSPAPAVRTVTVGDKVIVVMHGHTFGVKHALSSAMAYAAERGADVLLYGHTHIPHERTLSAGTEVADGVVLSKPLLVANPGSLGDPRGQDKTFGVLTVRDGVMLFSHGVLI